MPGVSQPLRLWKVSPLTGGRRPGALSDELKRTRRLCWDWKLEQPRAAEASPHLTSARRRPAELSAAVLTHISDQLGRRHLSSVAAPALTQRSVSSDGVFGGQAVSGPLSDVRMDGERPPLSPRGFRPSVQFEGRGRRRGLQEDRLPALAGVPQQGVYPQVLPTQPAAPVATQAHRSQHPHRRKTTRTLTKF